MKRNNLDFVKGLLAISENDWKIASAGMKEDLPLDGICFHIQQTAEKLLKALLACHGVDYPFTHDLEELLKLAAQVFPALGEFAKVLPDYTEDALLPPGSKGLIH